MIGIVMAEKQISKFVVTKVKGGKRDTRPVRGADLFPEVYSNIFICSKKKSGKTTVIHNILRECCGKKTVVYIFSSTVHKDDTYKAILKMLKEKDIVVHAHEHFMDGSRSLIKDVITELQEKARLEKEKEDLREERLKKEKENPSGVKLVPDIRNGIFWGGMKRADAEEEPEEKEKKESKLAPEFIFCFDDLSSDLRSAQICRLLKFNRHFKSKCIISSQWVSDLKPEGLRQIDYFLLFPSIPDKKLNALFEILRLNITLEQFQTLYKHATSEPYNFLYVDITQCLYRKNFNIALTV